MELGTFGAILSFALALEERTANFYDAYVSGHFKDLFLEQSRKSRQRLTQVEQARREGIAEMILEAIDGLDPASYKMEPKGADNDWQWLQNAIALEITASRFYDDASAKIPIKEVARLFRRLAIENRQRALRLQSLAEQKGPDK